MLEQKIEDRYCDGVRALGGKTRKLVYLGRKGCPDRLTLLPGILAVVEFKRSVEEKLRGEQERELAYWKTAGAEAYECHTIEECDALLADFAARLDGADRRLTDKLPRSPLLTTRTMRLSIVPNDPKAQPIAAHIDIPAQKAAQMAAGMKKAKVRLQIAGMGGEREIVFADPVEVVFAYEMFDRLIHNLPA